MRKIILFNMVSLDGFFEGPNREIDWHNVDEEFNKYSVDQTRSAGGLLFGRVTYELMASYWPTPEASSNDPQIAEIMNTIPKIVFSTTLNQADWNNTRLVKEDAASEVSKLKQETGKDLYIFGSLNLSETLIRHSLIDEFRIMVNPVVIGRGRSLFPKIQDRLGLKLLDTRQFRSGNVLLAYQPKYIRDKEKLP
jgi:dihydrofolate reductase